MSACQNYLEQNLDRYLEELVEFLRIPSISSLPEHVADVERAAHWVAARMRKAGIESVRICPTGGHPVVYGDWLHAPGKPIVLIYGHFDTQPVEPLDQWESPPFEPTVRNGRIYARGASDDKGNMLLTIQAVEALLQTHGALPVNVRFFFEGQEEIGSPDLPAFIRSNRQQLSCDFALSADLGQYEEDRPSLTVASRGLCGLQIDLRGPAASLHSGSHGGAVQNPLHAMVRLLDSMRSPDGTVLVEGFYDDVAPLSEEDRRMIAAVPYDEQSYLKRVGVEEAFGEPGYTVMERRWARPTLEINGLWGGFTGEGSQTVIPNQAHAKITCRLVPRQEPGLVLDRLEAHIRKHCPEGVRVEMQRRKGMARPYSMPVEHVGNRVAHKVLAELYGSEPLYIRTGGAVPVCELFHTHLNAHTVSFGFGLDDENIHAPNENFRLRSFNLGRIAYCRYLERLGEGP